ncbi:unnamed protein product, partial [Onchocerca ochengi]|uniref:DUF5641 domain-containing protein n=1 Tax=Onchocerca ochengi TaxID=42157 RepID=A0A182EUZ0_ONCOC
MAAIGNSLDKGHDINPHKFTDPNATLIISTTDDLDEFGPGKPDTTERLINDSSTTHHYWMGTLKVLDTVWETWKREYLTSLRERTQREHVNPKNSEDHAPIIEEILLVDESETPRGLWKLRKVKELKKGRNGVVRTALVEMPNGNYLTKSVNIEIDNTMGEDRQQTESNSEKREGIYERSNETTMYPYEYIASRTKSTIRKQCAAIKTVLDSGYHTKAELSTQQHQGMKTSPAATVAISGALQSSITKTIGGSPS